MSPPGPQRASPSSSPDPLLGLELDGRFRILEWLGASTGGGRVYRGMQATLERPVALKVFPADGAEPGLREWFLREAALIAKLRHPGSVRVMDYGESQGLLYVAMELVEGVTLAERQRRHGPLAWQHAAALTLAVARPVREAHSLGVTHRNLSPSTVLLLREQDQDVKVLDFGLVRPFTLDTLQGTGPGHEGALYLAPEQARGQADARTDIYALGLLLYELVTGQLPFQGATAFDVLVIKNREPAPPPSARRPGLELPPAFEALVMRCLEREPARRFQAVDDLMEALRALGHPGHTTGSHGRPPHTPPPHATMPPPPPHATMPPHRAQQQQRPPAPPPPVHAVAPPPPAPPKRSRLPLVGAIVGAMVVGGLGTALLLRRPAAPAPTPEPQAPAPTAAATTPAPSPAVEAPAAPAAVEPAPLSPTVRFHVESDPSGAKVRDGRKLLGTTPLVIEVDRGEGGTATAELSLTLDGYQPTTVISEGAGPDVFVHPKLQKRERNAAVKPTVVRIRQPAPPPAARPAPAPQPEATPLVVTPNLAVPAATPPAPQQQAPATAAAAPAPAPKVKNVPPGVLDAQLVRRDATFRFTDLFKRSHRGETLRGMYKVCVGTDGRVSAVTPVQSMPGADQDIARGIQDGWVYRPQAAPVCALYPLTVPVE